VNNRLLQRAAIPAGIEIRQGMYGASMYADRIAIAARFPLWFLCVTGVLLAVVARILRNIDAHRLNICLKCGYDLRGTPSNRCSECGTVIRQTSMPPSVWPISSFRTILALHLSIGVFWAICMRFYGSGISLWWPHSPFPAFLVQLCGPLSWVVSPYWPILEATVGQVGAIATVGLLAALVGWGWCVLLCRTRLARASLVTHCWLAVAWFCIGPLAAGIVIWVFQSRS
jgi:hypothetical protein